MKVAIITDQHFGARNDNQYILRNQRKFYEEVFFPELEKRNIKVLLDLGDTFDRRKYINYQTLHTVNDMWFKPLDKMGIECHSIVGNHTVYYKNTNEVNFSLVVEQYKNFHVYENEPVEIQLDGTKILMVPWMNSTNQENSLSVIKNSNADCLMGHFSISGFEMIKGRLCSDGLDKSIFKKFDTVYSGHFHHPSEYDNIKYLGAPYEMTWSDYEGKRGFHIFDTVTKELEFVQNPYRLFHKFLYDDNDLTLEQIESLDMSLMTGAYIKIIVREKNNPYIFDILIDKIQEHSPADIKIVEDHFNMDLSEEEDLLDEAEDTITILSKYADSIETHINKDKIKGVLLELHHEAHAI